MLAKRLKKGDTIGIIAPSNPYLEKYQFVLDNFKTYMETLGFKIKLSKNIFKIDKYESSAGTPEERAKDINDMFKDKSIDAIWCLQGGETANQVLDLIDFNIIKQNPKLFIGKSDIDLLLLAINKTTELITVHGPDPKIGRKIELDSDYNKEWFRKRLIEGKKEITPSSEWKTLKKGVCEGKIIGCNTSSILKLAGTKYFPNFNNAILFLESYLSDARKTIKELTQMKQIGIFNIINGIVIGSNYKFNDNGIGFTFEDIVLDICKEYDLPILKTDEFGHYHSHAFLPIGVRMKVDATNKTMKIIEDFVK